MYRRFGLSRDPFAPACDGDLFWEDAARAEVRRRAAALLRRGRGVRVRGERGTGRHALIEQIAGDLAAEGRPVLLVRDPAPAAPEAFLGALLAASGGPAAPGAPIADLAGELYARLLAALCRAGAPVVAVAAEGLSPGAEEELALLGDLRVAGQPLVCLLRAGGRPPADLDEVRLPRPGPDPLRRLLAHRAAACGRPDLLPADRLGALAAAASGMGDAVARAGLELSRMAFEGAPAGGPEPTPGTGVLPEEELGEVERLLDSLSPGH